MILSAEKDPMAFMRFMTTATHIIIDVELGDNESWSDHKADLANRLEPHLEGDFILLLGDEEKLTDTTAELILMIEDHDAFNVRDFFHG